MSIAFMIAFLCSDIKRRKLLSQKETTVLMAYGSWPMAMGTVFESEVAAETSGTFLPLFSFFHFVCISKLSTFLVEQICASVWWNILASSYDDVSVGGALNTNRTQIYVLTGSQKAPTKKHNKTEMKINRKAIISSFVRFERKCEEMKQKIERMKKELHF